MRQLNHQYEENDVTKNESTTGFGITFGGKIILFEKDDIRFQFSGGSGIGRYAALNFANSAAVKSDNTLDPITSYLGFIGYRHIWNDASIVGGEVNKIAWSASVNLLYSPVNMLTFGLEFMRGNRELENGKKGKFDRLQFSAKYNFSFATAVDHKNNITKQYF